MIPDISSLITAGALFVSNHSGGKDSQAMLINLLEIIPPKQLAVVHASLGAMEWPGALELAQKQAEAAGIPFIVARARKTLLEMVERRFVNRPEVPSWPSASTRQCTSDLKRGPIQREVRAYAKANGFKVIVNCLGLRAQESPSRAKRQAFRKNETDSNSVLTWYEWLACELDIGDERTEMFEIYSVLHNLGRRGYACQVGRRMNPLLASCVDDDDEDDD
ncbi:phosphoadenosine phosphosulfate reductase [Klebsiella pneumoniae]|nr:phosphoadenosine phosphosulfate reductase [Klebsiella pneumoniae]